MNATGTNSSNEPANDQKSDGTMVPSPERQAQPKERRCS